MIKKNLIESWITTTLGTLIAIFGGLTFWFDKTNLWGSIAMWVIGAMFVFANEKTIIGLWDKIPKLK